MITLRPANERGQADHGWLKSRFSFSFADYHDPDHMGFRHLRVINDDLIAPKRGFGMHPHRDMEIFSYVVAGEMAHTDSMGNKAVVRPGRVQLMGAGTGVQHSEMNGSSDTVTHLFQVWILPRQRGLPTSYQELDYADADLRNQAKLLVAPGAPDGAMDIRQDVRIYAARLDPDAKLTLPTHSGHGWLQVLSGTLVLNGTQPLVTGDGVAIEHEANLTLEAKTPAEILWFDMD